MPQTNKRPQRRFDEAEITRLRALSVKETLRVLGLYWKLDPDYVPNNNPESIRINVSALENSFEIIATGDKWFDTRARRGGGGAIDLTMHLYATTFPKAVKWLAVVNQKKPEINTEQ